MGGLGSSNKYIIIIYSTDLAIMSQLSINSTELSILFIHIFVFLLNKPFLGRLDRKGCKNFVLFNAISKIENQQHNRIYHFFYYEIGSYLNAIISYYYSLSCNIISIFLLNSSCFLKYSYVFCCLVCFCSN